MSKPVLNIADAPGFPMEPKGGSDRFGAVVAPMGAAIGARELGVMLTTVEPGKRAFPFHNHLGNEEMFVILDGTGEIRIGEASHPLRAGDVIACPRGGPETAHQIINSGDAPLRYLAISTQNDPDLCEYPDSGKYAAFAIAPGADFANAHLRVLGRREASLNYWDGEET